MAIIVSEVNAEIRHLLGGLPTTIVDDTLLDFIIQRNIDKYGDDDANLCIVTYQSLLDTLRYLIAKDAQGGIDGTGNNSVKRRKEVRGSTQIEVEYHSGSDGATIGWQELYDQFVADPSLVCESLVSDDIQSPVIIGGVSESKYQKIKNNPDARTGYAMGSLCRQRNRKWR